MSRHAYTPQRARAAEDAGRASSTRSSWCARNEPATSAREIWLAADRGYLPVRVAGRGEGRHALRAGGHAHLARREADARRCSRTPTRALAADRCASPRPADETLSRYFRDHRELGQQERAFVAETVFAVLRRKRSLEAAAGSAAAAGAGRRGAAARARPLGARARGPGRRRAARGASARCARRGAACRGARRPAGLAVAAPRARSTARPKRCASRRACSTRRRSTCASTSRAPTAKRCSRSLARDGIAAQPTPYSPAGLRLAGKPAINRHALFRDGLVEVQDEGSQLLAWLLAPRRGEMVADYCAGAGGKTLALGDADARHRAGSTRSTFRPSGWRRSRRARRAPASPTCIRIVLSASDDARAKRLAGKIDRVLVDAPCSGFGTLRRNPDLKWRQGPDAIDELAAKQRAHPRRGGAAGEARRAPGLRDLQPAARGERGGRRRLCGARTRSSRPLSCAELLAAQRIALERASACGCGRTCTAPTAFSPPPSSAAERLHTSVKSSFRQRSLGNFRRLGRRHSRRMAGASITTIKAAQSDAVFRLARPPLVGLRARRAGADAHHHRGGHDLPAPLPGAPRARPASGRVALLPLLALAHHRHGDQGVGRDPSQAPRQVRDRGRPAQPADPRHQQGALARRVPVRQGIVQQGDDGALRPRHAGRLDRAQRLLAPLDATASC